MIDLPKAQYRTRKLQPANVQEDKISLHQQHEKKCLSKCPKKRWDRNIYNRKNKYESTVKCSESKGEEAPVCRRGTAALRSSLCSLRRRGGLGLAAAGGGRRDEESIQGRSRSGFGILKLINWSHRCRSAPPWAQSSYRGPPPSHESYSNRNHPVKSNPTCLNRTGAVRVHY